MLTQPHGHHASVRFGCLTVFPGAATPVSVSAAVAVSTVQVLDELHRPQISRNPVHPIVDLQHSAWTEACAAFSLVQAAKGTGIPDLFLPMFPLYKNLGAISVRPWIWNAARIARMGGVMSDNHGTVLKDLPSGKRSAWGLVSLRAVRISGSDQLDRRSEGWYGQARGVAGLGPDTISAPSPHTDLSGGCAGRGFRAQDIDQSPWSG